MREEYLGKNIMGDVPVFLALAVICRRIGLPLTAPSLRAPPNPPREWSHEPLFDLPVPCYGAGQTGDLRIPDPACLPADR